MLVLSRRSNESIVIGGNIEVVVLGVEGDQVRLGIRAPKEVDIYRQEIYAAIQEQNRQAVTGQSTERAVEVAKLFAIQPPPDKK